MTDKHSEEVEKIARLLCSFEGEDWDPDSSLGGDKQNFLWMEYVRQAEGLIKSDHELIWV